MCLAAHAANVNIGREGTCGRQLPYGSIAKDAQCASVSWLTV